VSCHCFDGPTLPQEDTNRAHLLVEGDLLQAILLLSPEAILLKRTACQAVQIVDVVLVEPANEVIRPVPVALDSFLDAVLTYTAERVLARYASLSVRVRFSQCVLVSRGTPGRLGPTDSGQECAVLVRTCSFQAHTWRAEQYREARLYN
jgi:hypothetical protein